MKTTKMSERPLGVWECKIGDGPVVDANGLDLPMRKAVEAAYRQITGQEPDYLFSGWRHELTEQERAVVEDRLPDPAKVTVTITQSELDQLREDSEFLDCLEQRGVDNWEGYSDAVQLLNGEDPDA